MTNNEEIAKKINKSVFPKTQGGPLENIIAAKAVCFWEALKPEFKTYQKQVIKNAQKLAEYLVSNGIDILTGGTDNHLLLIDLRKNNITGKELEERLEKIDIITNKNAIPFDTENKKTTSGLRIGTAAVTSRGMKEEDMLQLAIIISSVIKMDKDVFDAAIPSYKTMVADLASKYPLYSEKRL